MHQFLKFILEWNSTCFGQLLCPSSGVIHCTHCNGIRHTNLLTACKQNQDGILILFVSSQQTCMTYTIAVFTVKNSWWWTDELSETCRISFQNKFEKLMHLVVFIVRNVKLLISQNLISCGSERILKLDIWYVIPCSQVERFQLFRDA